MSSQNNAIGGYFELELPPQSTDYHQGALQYQSARSAFLSLMRSMPHVQRVWMPYYICDSMLSPVQAAGKELVFYNLDQQFNPKCLIELASTDILLYVNYFGVCDQQVRDILKKLNPAQVIIDCSQAFYSAPVDCLATIYSPRKFFGIPDGGLLLTTVSVTPPAIQDTSSEGRMGHLIKRLGGTAEAGYQDFKHAEASLENLEPRGMSNLTHSLLQSVNFEAAREARNRNFSYLRKHLDKTNTLILPAEVDGPHCYPYLPAHPVHKDTLIRNRIFVATYWPDVLARVGQDSIEAHLVRHCIPIPCDQRYSEDTLSRIHNLL